ncbi:WG repeat-containing protein [Mucilaginibacter sp. L196]|uniref:WG repeat-containing protein n=1 Tax=Mucilaginibacter sp. L196 TaxID=1641870 RepID=UPI00131E2E1E|nr:WG repeat-containing protein [Mucilaginibacter sp. L196]
MNPIDFIFSLLKKKSIYIQILVYLAVIILNLVAKRYNIIGDALSLRIYLTLIPIIIFIPLNKFLNRIITSKEKGFLSPKVHSKNKILIAKISKVTSIVFLLIVIPVYLLQPAYKLLIKLTESDEQLCKDNLKKKGLYIANFSSTPGQFDGFTSSLFGRLNSVLQNVDTLNVKELSNFINETDPDYLNKIKSIFSNNCNKAGLIIFGNRQDNTFFNCRIYSFNFLNYKAKGFSKTKDSTIIYIQNPKTLHFTIDYETNVVSKFILGLLYRNNGNYILSIKLLKQALKLNKNTENKQFISLCHLFIGNDLLNQGLPVEAKKEYKIGEQFNPNNEWIHYNIGASDNAEKDTAGAFKQYSIAESINPSLKNPFDKIYNEHKIITYNLSINKHLSLKKNDSIINKSKIDTTVDWEEHCYISSAHTKIKKYGVINNKGDTIIKFQYDTIENYIYKKADCFIVKSNGKYGAIIHKHRYYGWDIWPIKVEYSLDMIKYVIENCVDHHYNPN